MLPRKKPTSHSDIVIRTTKKEKQETKEILLMAIGIIGVVLLIAYLALTRTKYLTEKSRHQQIERKKP